MKRVVSISQAETTMLRTQTTTTLTAGIHTRPGSLYQLCHELSVISSGMFICRHKGLQARVPYTKILHWAIVFFVAQELHATAQPCRYTASEAFSSVKKAMRYISGVRRKFSWGGLVQGHMVVICFWCALFATSQFDVISMFPNERFGEVCWHSMHCFLHPLSLLYMSLHWIWTISAPS